MDARHHHLQTLSAITLGLILAPWIAADEPIPTGVDEAPVLKVEIGADGELMGTATDDNLPIEITVERVGESEELEVETETSDNEVTFSTTDASGDPNGVIYKVTAVDRCGNTASQTLTRLRPAGPAKRPVPTTTQEPERHRTDRHRWWVRLVPSERCELGSAWLQSFSPASLVRQRKGLTRPPYPR